MTREQAGQIVQMVNALWPQKPIEGIAADMLRGALSRMDFDATCAALQQLYARERWFSFSDLAGLVQARGENALPSGVDVLKAIRAGVNLYGRAAGDHAGPALNAVVRQLGGWEIVRQWSRNDRDEPFHVKAVSDAIAFVDRVDGVVFDAMSLSPCVETRRQMQAEADARAGSLRAPEIRSIQESDGHE